MQELGQWASRDGISSYRMVREATLRLTEPLSVEDQCAQSMTDASPTKWHLAHTTWFFETFVLRPHKKRYQSKWREYEGLFNSYYNSLGQPFSREKRGLLSRPSLSEVIDYRRDIDAQMLQLLESEVDGVNELVELGLHHEQQHQELILTDIKHLLFQNPLLPAYSPMLVRKVDDDAQSESKVGDPEFVRKRGGRICIGYGGEGFRFDNETPRHDVLLSDYEIATRPVSCGEVLLFIEQGGYRDPLLWLSDGWDWVKRTKKTRPLYWLGGDLQRPLHFTLHGVLPIDPAEPAAHLSFFEADALARFYGYRLPTEQEWERAALDGGGPFDSNESLSFLDLSTLHPSKRTSSTSFMTGQVWEWTASAYLPYPGFTSSKEAVGEYNGKFMHGQMVLRGGSCVTPPGHIRPTYRNFFPSHAMWQFSGARFARHSNVL